MCQVFFSRGPSRGRNLHIFVEEVGNATEGVLTINVKDINLEEDTEVVKQQKIQR